MKNMKYKDECHRSMENAIASELLQLDFDNPHEETICQTRISYPRSPSCFTDGSIAANGETDTREMASNSFSTSDSTPTTATHHTHETPPSTTIYLSVGIGFTFGLLLAALGLLLFCFIRNKRAKAERDVITQSNQPMINQSNQLMSDDTGYASITGIYETISSTPSKASPVVPPAVRSRYSSTENQSEKKASLSEKQSTPSQSPTPIAGIPYYATVNKPILEKNHS